MQRGWYWPWIIVTLLVLTAAGQGVMLYAATHDRTFSIEPDYYQKAVAWDTVMQQQSANRALGWQARASIGALEEGRREVVLDLADANGEPLADAKVRIVAIHNLDGDAHVAQTLAPDASARFRGRLPLAHAGMWELRVTALRGRDQFTASLRVDAPR